MAGGGRANSEKTGRDGAGFHPGAQPDYVFDWGVVSSSLTGAAIKRSCMMDAASFFFSSGSSGVDFLFRQSERLPATIKFLLQNRGEYDILSLVITKKGKGIARMRIR